MSIFSPRLPHVLPPADMAQALLDTYTDALGVDDEEALDRLGRAFDRPELLDGFYRAISAALVATQGLKASSDAVIDKLRKGVQKRQGRVKAVADHPAVAAVLVWINLEAGVAPEKMREALQTDKGRRLIEDGLSRLGAHLAAELLK